MHKDLSDTIMSHVSVDVVQAVYLLDQLDLCVVQAETWTLKAVKW